MSSLPRLLALPAVYRGFVHLVGKDIRRVYAEKYLQARRGERVCDIGCGPGDTLSYLPPVDYVGIDISAGYIKAAQKRFGHMGRFLCRDLTQAAADNLGKFDLVMANGLLHHLDDDEAMRVLNLASRLLERHGRLVTLDGCYVDRQSWFARWMLRMDRGKFVRPKDGYLSLAQRVFPHVACHERHDLIRIPYTHLIMECAFDASALATPRAA
jgi:SAM-dependent methyltransferase